MELNTPLHHHFLPIVQQPLIMGHLIQLVQLWQEQPHYLIIGNFSIL